MLNLILNIDLMDFFTILSGLLAPLIAIIATYIAFQQYQSNKKQGEYRLQLDIENSELEKRRLKLEEYQLKLDLYNKRFRVFEETKKVLHKIVQDAQIELLELRDFRFSTNESKFLFGTEISDFLEELKTKAIKLNHSETDLKSLNHYPEQSQKRNEKIKENQQLLEWFNSAYDNIEYKFEKYLNFKNL